MAKVLIQWYILVFEDLTSHFDFWKKIYFCPNSATFPIKKKNSNFFRKLQGWMSQHNLTKGWIQIICMRNTITAKTQWAQMEIQETLFKCKKKNHTITFLPGGWSGTGTGYSEQFWSLSPCKCSKFNCSWPWATCSHSPCSEQRLGLDGLQRCLPTSVTLWSSDY